MTLAAARAALAPRGVLRAAINLSNFLLVSDQTGATPRGISPSLCGSSGTTFGSAAGTRPVCQSGPPRRRRDE